MRGRGSSLPSLVFNAFESLVIEGPVSALVELLKPQPDLLAQLIELIALLQQSQRFTDHLAGRGVAPRVTRSATNFSNSGVKETFIARLQSEGLIGE